MNTKPEKRELRDHKTFIHGGNVQAVKDRLIIGICVKSQQTISED